ncbi:hypothetical protein DFP72DRAFT_850118 [Ephemerocybe angulata]|uniref:Uncharacterized protein n=1 Tax=Ephemerocybe angulata TaxID=980116 RepID=A0A8H6M1S4_9AGAR|nr:hypothetical protein DFP72DRAFT_850118 [Tulosesus angulatus]
MPKQSNAEEKKKKGTGKAAKETREKPAKEKKGTHASRTASAVNEKLSGLLKKGSGSSGGGSNETSTAGSSQPVRTPSPTSPESTDKERIRQLEAQIALLESSQSPPAGAVDESDVCHEPEGEVGRSGEGARKGYNLQDAMKLTDNSRLYGDILRQTRAGIDHFDFKESVVYKKQDQRKCNAMFPYTVLTTRQLTKHCPYITAKRFPCLWVVMVLTHYCFQNKRADYLKKQRQEAKGKAPPPKKKRRTAGQRRRETQPADSEPDTTADAATDETGAAVAAVPVESDNDNDDGPPPPLIEDEDSPSTNIGQFAPVPHRFEPGEERKLRREFNLYFDEDEDEDEAGFEDNDNEAKEESGSGEDDPDEGNSSSSGSESESDAYGDDDEDDRPGAEERAEERHQEKLQRLKDKYESLLSQQPAASGKASKRSSRTVQSEAEEDEEAVESDHRLKRRRRH